MYDPEGSETHKKKKYIKKKTKLRYDSRVRSEKTGRVLIYTLVRPHTQTNNIYCKIYTSRSKNNFAISYY